MTSNSSSSSSGSNRNKAIMIGIGALLVGGVAIAVGTGSGGLTGSRMVDVTLPAGTTMVGVLQNTISTENGEVGTPIRLETAETVSLGEGLSLPAGVEIRGAVTHTQGGGRVAGAPELTLRFTEITVNGDDHRITAEPFRLRGKNDAVQSVALIGGGAVVGGVVGAVTGAGTAEGAVVGAVLGTGVAIATKGDQLVVSSGQRLRIRLTEAVVVKVARSPEARDESK